MLLLLGWYAYSILMARSFLTCDARDRRRRTDRSGDRLRSIFHLLRGIASRFVLVRRGLVRQLISLFEVNVRIAAWKAFDTFVKTVPKDELDPSVVPLRRTIEGTGASGRCLGLTCSSV